MTTNEATNGTPFNIYDRSHLDATTDGPTLNLPAYRSSTIRTLLTWTPKPDKCAPEQAVPGTRKVGNWSVHVNANGTRDIRHYYTTMLVLAPDPKTGDPTVVGYSTGHGSVSDQGMMNRLFRALPDCTLYFSRRGGASIG